MVRVNFYLRKRGKDESARKGNVAYSVYSILMRVSFYGKRMELSTGLHACEIQWNRASQRIKLDVDGMMPMSYVNAGLEQLVVVVQHANSASQRKGQMLTDKKIANAVALLRARLARMVGHNEGKSHANSPSMLMRVPRQSAGSTSLVLTRISCAESVILASSAGHSNTNITPSTTSSISHLSSASHRMSRSVLQRRNCTGSSTSAYRLRNHPSSV